ncbi:MAG TPA: putative hydro-lyase, partial [Chloroflexia bacterium]|nr:putative hydro-lyase [Chloroflexia bacterium]
MTTTTLPALRTAIREGLWTTPTAGQAPGYAQANLVVLPAADAEAFAAFCAANPKPCPVLEVTAPGDPVPHQLAPTADLRTDVPRYRVYRDGALVAEPTDIRELWRDDLVAFLIGCSFTFERALLAAGIPVRHIDQGRNVPMYRTTQPCAPAGPFAGPLVVSMRPLPPALVPAATAITARYPHMHGAPVHAGDAAALGIADLAQPDYGESVTVYPGEVPVFWACGVT